MAGLLGYGLDLGTGLCSCSSSLHKSEFSALRNGEATGPASKRKRIQKRGRWMVVSASEERNIISSENEDNGQGNLTRRGVVGFMALAAPALFASVARGAGGLDSNAGLEHSRLARWHNSKDSLDGLDWAVSLDVGVPNSVSHSSGDEAIGQLSVEESGGNPLGFLNDLGVIGSGILGALYWLEGKAKATSDSALEDANKKLKQTEAAMESLKETLEASLLAQKEESLKQQARYEEERGALWDELNSTKGLANELHQQLDQEKALVKSLEDKGKVLQSVIADSKQAYAVLEKSFGEEKTKMDSLVSELGSARECLSHQEKSIEGLKVALEKQKTLTEELTYSGNETNEALKKSNLRVRELEDEISSAGKVFAEKEKEFQHIEGRLVQAIKERDQIQEELATSRDKFDQALQSANQRIEHLTQAATSKEKEAEDLASKLADKTLEFERAVETASDLKIQVQKWTKSFTQEQETVQRLTQELAGASLDLEAASKKVHTLSKEVADSQGYALKLEKKVLENEAASNSKILSLTEWVEKEQAMVAQLQKALDDTKNSLEHSVREVSTLKKELKEMMAKNQKLDLDVRSLREVASSTSDALSEEKQKSASLEKQVVDLQNILSEKEELVSRLQIEFNEVIAAMESLKPNVESLSLDLEAANSQIVFLEGEKKATQESLQKERRAAKKLKEKAVQLEVVLEKAIQERGDIATRAQKLEGELRIAKAEIVNMSEQLQVMGHAIESAELRIDSIARVGTEASSLVQKFEMLASNLEEKEALQSQSKQLQKQSNIVTEITRELKSMKKEVSHFKQSLEGIESAKAEAEAAIQSLSMFSKPETSANSENLVSQVAEKVDV